MDAAIELGLKGMNPFASPLNLNGNILRERERQRRTVFMTM